MATTQNTYTANGTNKLFSITFPYLDTTDIDVYVNGTLTTAYTFANATTIEFTTAPANGATVLLDRSTDDSALQATFFPGSSIKAADLNYNFDQVLYLSQETANNAANQSTAGLQAQITAATNTANNAITIATGAETTANGIAGTANTALSNSSAAVSTANAASVTATNAETTANSISAVANAALPKAGGTMTGNLNVVSLNGGQLAGMRNRIINGDMQIAQRNAGAAINNAASGAYGVDRFVYEATQASKFNIQQNAGSVTPPTGFTNYLGATSTSAYTLGTSDAFFISQRIEGFNSADFAWGTSDAKAVIMSFWVRSSLTGTFGGCIQNSAQNRSYPFAYAISSANTWEFKTVSIPGDTSGTWLTNNGVGLFIFLGLGVGSTFLGTAGVWSGSNFRSATGATSVVGTSGATFYITGVQLEPGSTATPFERRSYGQELALCQRYYCQWTANNELQYDNYQASGANAIVFVSHPVQMRATPTLTIIGSIPTNNAGAAALTAISALRSQVQATASSAGRTQISNAINNGFSASAEL